MGQEESTRCRVCATRLNPKNKRELESNLCPQCQQQSSKVLWDNRARLKNIVFGEQPDEKQRIRAKREAKEKRRKKGGKRRN